MAGSVVSCTVALVAVVKVCAASADEDQRDGRTAELGITAASAQPTPKDRRAPGQQNRCAGFVRRADSRAPSTEPTAIIEVSRP